MLKNFKDMFRITPIVKQHIALIKSSTYFDTDFYLAQNPDVKAVGMEPVKHFVDSGWRENRDPSPEFSVRYYLEKYSDVKAADLNPLVHYLTLGRDEGRFRSWGDEHIALIKSSTCFDTEFYLAQNPDVKADGMDPVKHFVYYGWRENRDPSPEFSVRYYLENYSDVKAAGINPLVHYLAYGHDEERFRSCDEEFDNVAHFRKYLQNETLEKIILDPIRLEVLYHIGMCNQDYITTSYANCELSFTFYESPKVSIIIPIHNQITYTLQCLFSLTRNVDPDIPFEVIVVDDYSSDDSADILSKINGLTVFTNEQNLGFVGSCNIGASLAKGEYLVFLNNDTVVLPGWLENLLDTFSDCSRVGLAGSMLLYPNGQLQEAGGIIWEDGSGWNYGNNECANQTKYLFVRDVDYCSGASIMIKRELFNEIGGFDESYSPGYYEDTDLAFTVRKSGFRTVYQPFSKLIHFEGITAGVNLESGMKKFQNINKEKFVNKWNSTITGFGSPNALPRYYQDRSVERHALVIDGSTPTPDQDSGSNDTLIHIGFLQQAGFRVTFAASDLLYFGKYTDILQKRGVECIYRSRSGYIDIDQYLEQEGDRYDLIWVYRWSILDTHLSAISKYCPHAKLVFDTVDLHHIRLKGEADLLNDKELLEETHKVKLRELDLTQKADITIVISEQEATYLSTYIQPESIAVLPMCRNFPGRKNGFRKRQPNIVFIGGFQHNPNVDAVVNFVNTVWPRIHESAPHSKFLIVGSRANAYLPEINVPGVEIIGFIEDLSEILENCLMTVAPLRFGAGVKGKLLTSLGHGVPAVLSHVAIEGTNLIAGKHCVLADTPDEYHSAILELLNNNEKWEQLSNEGLQFVQSTYSVSNVRNTFNQIINNLGFI